MMKVTVYAALFAASILNATAQLGGVHLYDGPLDKAAQAAQASYTNNRPVKIIDLEESRLSDWAKRKAQLIQAQQIAIRDAEIVSILQSDEPLSQSFYNGGLVERLTNWCGSRTFATIDYSMEDELLAGPTLRFKLLTGTDLPVVDPVTALSQEDSNKVSTAIQKLSRADLKQVATDTWARYVKARQTIQAAITDAASGGELKGALQHWKDLLKERSDNAAKAAEAANAVEQAQKELNDTIASVKTNGWQTVGYWAAILNLLSTAFNAAKPLEKKA